MRRHLGEYIYSTQKEEKLGLQLVSQNSSYRLSSFIQKEQRKWKRIAYNYTSGIDSHIN